MNPENPRICVVGICSSKPQSGKSTIAKHLAGYGFNVFSFAEPIKRMTIQFLMSFDIDSQKACYYAYEAKEEVIPELGVTCRHIQQTLGTEWGRSCIHKNVWMNRLELAIERSTRNGGCAKFVVDDLRFDNEYNFIKQFGGKVWFVERDHDYPQAEHESEAHWPKFQIDKFFINTSGEAGYQQFQEEVGAYVRSFIEARMDWL